MPAWGLQGEGLIVTGILAVAAIFVCVLPALAAGKWDGWLLVFSGLCGVGFAAWGYYEYEVFGAITGGISGSLIAFIVLGAPFGLFGAMSGAKGDERDRDGQTVENVKASTRVLLFLGRLVGVVLLVGACHELYWAANIASNLAGVQIAEELCRLTADDAPLEHTASVLQTMSARSRFFRIKPLGWIILPEEQRHIQLTIEVADFVSGRHVERGVVPQWPEWVVESNGFDLPTGDPTGVESARLNHLGVQVGRRFTQRAESLYDRTIVLRYLPRQPFEPKVTSLAGGDTPAL